MYMLLLSISDHFDNYISSDSFFEKCRVLESLDSSDYISLQTASMLNLWQNEKGES